MNALRNHAWGRSPAADHVWSLVTGMAPSLAVRRLFMPLTAFIDESESDAEFVLGGYIADTESWAKFSERWEDLLPLYGRMDKEGRYYFKMSEMTDRIECLPHFFRVIKDHVTCGLTCRFNKHDLRRALARLWVPDLAIDFGFVEKPYMLGFRMPLDMFHSHRDKLVELFPADEKVRFIFDERHESKKILKMWADYIEARPPETKDLYSDKPPTFEDDKEFVALQAADFWIWWVRRWHDEGIVAEMFEGTKKWPWETVPPREDAPPSRKYWFFHMTFDEDQIFRELRRFVQAGIDPGRYVYDLRYPRDQMYSMGGMKNVRFRGPSPFGPKARFPR